MTAGEWLRAPSRAGAVVAIVLALVTLALKRRGYFVVSLALLAVAVAVGELRLERLARHWPEEREARIQAASGRLASELRDARLLADTLARRALEVARSPREAGFQAVAGLVRGVPLEAGLAVFEPTGDPSAWSGRFRLLPTAAGDSIDVRLTSYYAVLEVRRHDAAGRTAVGAVLLAAHSAVPDQERSLAARFQERTEVGLRVLPADEAPNSSDVFDYELPVNGGTRVLFSAQLVPPEQARAVARAQRAAGKRVAWALVLTLLLALWLVPAGIFRVGLALLPILVALRSPLGVHLGIPQPFDASYFSSDLLGPVSRSAGPLALVGVVLLLLGALVWERGRGRRWAGVVAAVALLVGAPYLLAELGRGIIPPATGVSMGLWLVWHLTLFLFSAGVVTLAAALLRAPEGPHTGWWPPVLGAGLALAAAAIGVLVWNARYGWPDLYTLLWVPPLILVTRPANRRATILGIAVVAGSATALLAWGAEVEGRLRAARADMAALGDTVDPSPESALRALGDTLAAEPVPGSAPELYARWRSSELSREGRPVALGVWRPDGTPLIELPLDQLDLPAELTATLVRSLSPVEQVNVAPLRREPAMHYMLLVRRDGKVITVALGPRSALVPPSRLGRLLTPPAHGTPLYRLTLAPAPSSRAPEPGLALWSRDGWQAIGQRTVLIGGIARDVFGTVELGTPGRLAVRGTLVVALDVAVLAGLWWLAAVLGGLGTLRPRWIPRLRSYEARLGAALAVFFLAPTLGFAAWGLGRLRTEIRESQDRMIDQSLRDVISPGTSLPADTAALSRELHRLGERLDATFLLYRNGQQLAGSTGGLLEALGLVSPLMDPEAFYRGAFHGEASAAGPSRVVESRIGYRAVRLSDLSAGALAMSLVAADPVLFDRQRDLALLLILATLAGVAASLLAARVAARVLARPVADLRHAALAFGRGEPASMPEMRPPLEFAPVFAAFEKMTEDVRRARDAQERVARIVAWGQMANQVAHEIKNPLTPMRLGVQHLRRVYHDGRTPIGPVLEDTTQRILSEIDRLDRIARSFSRFGAPASDRGPLEEVSLPRISREVADLYRIGDEGAEITVDAEQGGVAQGRADEVKETLINLLENARNARATRIRVRIIGTTVEVEDDGCGIPPGLLPMIFEPRWSTSTSGSGLGLPIVKRLVEGWGGRVEVESAVGRGTMVRLIMLPGGGVARDLPDGVAGVQPRRNDERRPDS